MNGNGMISRCPVVIGSWSVLLALFTLAPAASAMATPHLLHTFPGQVGGASDSLVVFDELVFTLFFAGPEGPIPVPPWPVRYGALSVDLLAQQGVVFSFSAANTQAFPEFARLATDGNAQDVLVDGVETLRGLGGVYGARTEQEYRWASSSLYRVDEVRLVVSSLSIAPDHKSYLTDYHWELWGDFVPEPCTLLLIAPLFLGSLHRRPAIR